ncbi:hypothetical protein FPQ18DRAFT_306572 [Pyronema domesticum]|nr:hypothetical protein FPQ18DRAFT_306572 [Pyronema domesticum]
MSYTNHILRSLDSTYIDPDTCIPTPSARCQLMLFEASISLSMQVLTPSEAFERATFHRRDAARRHEISLHETCNKDTRCHGVSCYWPLMLADQVWRLHSGRSEIPPLHWYKDREFGIPATKTVGVMMLSFHSALTVNSTWRQCSDREKIASCFAPSVQRQSTKHGDSSQAAARFHSSIDNTVTSSSWYLQPKTVVAVMLSCNKSAKYGGTVSAVTRSRRTCNSKRSALLQKLGRHSGTQMTYDTVTSCAYVCGNTFEDIVKGLELLLDVIQIASYNDAEIDEEPSVTIPDDLTADNFNPDVYEEYESNDNVFDEYSDYKLDRKCNEFYECSLLEYAKTPKSSIAAGLDDFAVMWIQRPPSPT